MPVQTGYQLAYSPIYDLTDTKIDLWLNDVSKDVAAHGGKINTKSISMTQMTILQMFNAPVLKALGHTNSGRYSASLETVDDAAVVTYLNSRGIGPEHTDNITQSLIYTPHPFSTGQVNTVIAAVTMDYMVTVVGNSNEDFVTNGTTRKTVRLSKLLKDNSAYTLLAELGTKPNVFYLPPNRKNK